MKPKKYMLDNKKPVERKYAERGISFYPLKPEEVLSAFMRVDPEKTQDKPKKNGPKK